VTLRYALKKSINMPAIRLLDKVRIPVVASYARRMGIKSPIQNVPRYAGTKQEVNLEELTTASLRQPGHPHRTALCDPGRGPRGANARAEREPERALGAETAAIMASMLEDDPLGHGGRARASSACASGGRQDRDHRRVQQRLVHRLHPGDRDRDLGRLRLERADRPKMEGARVALPIWTDFMLEATRDRPPIPFPIPSTIVTARVCSESGMLAREGCVDPMRALQGRHSARGDL
jgi:membrane peptidoglycan carboxypeptidase